MISLARFNGGDGRKRGMGSLRIDFAYWISLGQAKLTLMAQVDWSSRFELVAIICAIRIGKPGGGVDF